ncbi:peptidoglycan DD-metalloendopeptidase family protein, partial [Agromyces soli]
GNRALKSLSDMLKGKQGRFRQNLLGGAIASGAPAVAAAAAPAAPEPAAPAAPASVGAALAGPALDTAAASASAAPAGLVGSTAPVSGVASAPVAPAPAPAPVSAPVPAGAAPASAAAAPAPARAAAAPAPAFDSLFGDLLVTSDEDAPIGTATRPIVLPEASVSPVAEPTVDLAAASVATRRSRASAAPVTSSRSTKRDARRRGAEVPTPPRGRSSAVRPGNAAFAAASPGATSAAKPASGSAARPTPMRRRAARMTTLVAMSFAALLAVATSVPSLSLLSAADVQAMALSGSDSGREPGQTLDTSGDAIASPNVDLESYKSQSIAEYAEAAGIRAEATFTNNPNGTIQWPFAVGVHIGDRFGYRDCAGCSSDHHGQDFNPGYGAEIQAIADGVVSQSTDSGGSLGTVMMIDHVIDGEVVTSVYAHMISGSRRFEVGDTVKVGDVIGQTGNTGMSTGPHLHFEIRLGGVNGTWTDPLEWLYANTN